MLQKMHSPLSNGLVMNSFKSVLCACSFRTADDLFTVTGNPDTSNWDLVAQLHNLLPFHKTDPILPKYPFHVTSRVYGSNLHIELIFQNDDWYSNQQCFTQSTKKFRLFLHRPDEFREPYTRPIKIGAGKKVTVTVNPFVIATPNYLRKYDLKDRQCILADERPLKYFKVYTDSNCKSECHSNVSRSICGCVSWLLPRTF